MIYYNTVSYRPDQDIYQKNLVLPITADYVCIYGSTDYTTANRSYSLTMPLATTDDYGRKITILVAKWDRACTLGIAVNSNQVIWCNGNLRSDYLYLCYASSGSGGYTRKTTLTCTSRSGYSIYWEATETKLMN